jgi:hypothetical protein
MTAIAQGLLRLLTFIHCDQDFHKHDLSNRFALQSYSG